MPLDSQWIETKARDTLDPPAAGNALSRLVDSWPEALPPLDDVMQACPLGEGTLLHLLAYSPVAAGRIARDPELLLWISEPGVTDVNRTLPQMRRDLLLRHRETTDADAASGVHDAKFTLLRRQKAREMVRIALREIARAAPIEQTAAEISSVAELCVSEVFETLNRQLRERWGNPDSEFSVIALGKFGGGELNFSSDIDVIYLYSQDGHLNPNFSYKEFFTRLAERITTTFSEPSTEGPLFRIDLRLRPDGSSGALVRSLEAMENYYAAYGETWERMMLIKARPVAGDPELGYEFTQHLQAFVYPRHLTRDVLHEIAHVKKRIDTEYLAPDERDREIKRGPGGIREIEFVIQSLQLLHGSHHAFLQQPNSLKALAVLDHLSHGKLINHDQAETLADAYRFLRTLEHRIHIEEEHQTHLLPDSPITLAKIAVSLGFQDIPAFQSRLTRVRSAVRAIFDSHFSGDDDNEPEVRLDIFDSPDQAEKLLAKLGGDVTKAGTVSPRTRRVFERLQPAFLDMLAKTAEPDIVLNRFLRFVENYGLRATLYELLVQHPRLLEWLTRLFDSCGFAADVAIKRPELADIVARGGQLDHTMTAVDYLAAIQLVPPRLRALPPGDRLRAFRDGEILRIALRDVLEIAPIDSILAEYTALAEACLAWLSNRFDPGSALTIVALGKFGARELSYGSDLDIVFVGDDTATAQKLTAEFSRASPEGGALYELDLRLRPEGRSGLLTYPLCAYERYFAERAALWEGQMLTKARTIRGTDADAFMALAKSTWERFGAREDLFPGIREMLEKIHENRAKRGNLLDIKTGRGGMIEIEFAVQAHQMRTGLWETNTLRAIDILRQNGALSATDAHTLDKGYRFLRRILFVLRRQDNRALSSLPDNDCDQERLARRLGFESRETFFAEYQATRTQLTTLCTRLLAP